MKINNRLSSIEEYHFKRIDEVKQKAILSGKEIVDLSIGDPDLQVHENVINGVIEGMKEKRFNNYPPYEGTKELKMAVIKYYEEVYNVKLNMDEVIVLIGSKEGINNIIPAVCDIGDYVVVPEPGYPVYSTCAKLWGCKYYTLPLKESKNYLPDFDLIPKNIISKCKMLFINYPNNPTGAVANEEFFGAIIKFCYDNNIVLCNDAAYNEVIKENEKPLSLLKFDNEKRCVEFGTLSKTYNMTGFRVGYAVGNVEVINSLLKVKSNVDSGQFLPIQRAALEALSLNREYVNGMRKIFDERISVIKEILKEKNIKFFDGSGTFYVWCKTPKGYTTNEFCEKLIKEFGIVVTPGYCFGNLGFEYFRIAATKDVEIIKKALIKLPIF